MSYSSVPRQQYRLDQDNGEAGLGQRWPNVGVTIPNAGPTRFHRYRGNIDSTVRGLAPHGWLGSGWE